MKQFPEFRQDLISGDWILVAGGREKRPLFYKKQPARIMPLAKRSCPFEDPQQHGSPNPVLWYPHPSKIRLGLRSKSFSEEKFESLDFRKDWFIQVLQNKYPAVRLHGKVCPAEIVLGPYSILSGEGFHELFITRPHARSFAKFSNVEASLVLRSYQDRYRVLSGDKCIKYISIFHNHGFEAGASVPHPHSQLIAVPIVPPDVSRSIEGSKRYFNKHKRCGHCTMLGWEREHKERIIYSNTEFIAFAPFASRISSEIRLYPVKHESHFEYMSGDDIPHLAESLTAVLSKLFLGMKDIAYNMFIHTAPPRSSHDHYHWHIEILPKTSIWAGWELGTGIEIVAVSPEETAKFLRGVSVKR